MEQETDPRWVRFLSSGYGLGGFPLVLKDMLKAGGVTSEPMYEGYCWLGLSPAKGMVSISMDPCVPEFLGVAVAASDFSKSEVIQTTARLALRQVGAQLAYVLAGTPYRLLPRQMGMFRPVHVDWELYRYHVENEPDPRLQLAYRCLQTQDQELQRYEGHQRTNNDLRRAYQLKIDELRAQLKELY
ncbi:MAG TPA: hypothetical protein VFK94_01400, partial [Patescibacteria group bacterium]|nr:hypothetical protein [Patescibacteria group bacterium]